MRSRLPKVLHPLAGRPLLDYVLAAAEGISSSTEEPTGEAADPPGQPLPLVVVIGPDTQAVRAQFSGRCHFATEPEPLGTADAALAAQPVITALSPQPSHVLILAGDAPLITTSTLRALIQAASSSHSPLAFATAQAQQPTGYGRVVRDEHGAVRGIIEEKNASPAERAITEINSGIYCVEADWLWEHLPRITRNALSGEYYLVDLVGMAAAQGHAIPTISASLEELMGINDRVQLAQAERIMRGRILERLMRNGVTVIDPPSTFIDAGVQIGQDTVIHPFTTISGRTAIGQECVIGPHSVIRDSAIADQCVVIGSWLEEARLEPDVHVGPMSHLRPGAHLARGVHLGNYAEVKKSYIGANTQMHHFSYMGDATVGSNVNIGAGAITLNYDGTPIKKQTIIGDNAFIGSDTLLIAPVTVGQGASTGAGAVVKRNVEPGALVVGMPARPIRRVVSQKGDTIPAPEATARPGSEAAGGTDAAGTDTAGTGMVESGPDSSPAPRPPQQRDEREE
jgi:bifunctional UDP-N-acetylglucosamine pyrophosphorylase/glucosamine-1-phosphate N-acetyltransferase